MADFQSPGVNTTEVDLTTIIPGVSTTSGGIAGVFGWGPIGEIVEVANVTALAAQFGTPTSNNFETFFTGADFLSYSSSLKVSRAANTTSNDVTVSAMSAYANVGAVANVDAQTIINKEAYDTFTSFDANVYYIAKYAGTRGSSLKVSICDSVNAYSSNVSLIGNVSSNTVTGSFEIDIGSNTGNFVFLSAGTVSAAQTFANTVASSFVVGDLVTVGNSSIGKQLLKISAIGNSSANSTAASLSLSFVQPYRLAINYVANTTVNGSNTVINLQRSWEFANAVSGAPITSSWVATYGNNAAVDTMHVVVTDTLGQFSNVAGQVVDTWSFVSRATDAKNSDGSTNYYKTVINNGSQYIWYANDRAGALSANAASITSSGNPLPLTLQMVGGADGYSESNIPLNVLANAYNLFADAETVDVALLMQGKPIGGTTVVNGLTVNNWQLANYLLGNIADIRKDVIVTITPDDGAIKNNPGLETEYINAWRASLADDSYAFYDSGYKYVYDKYNDTYRWIPQNGATAGLMALTEKTNDAWWSPAGYNRGKMKNVVKLRWSPSKPQRDAIYPNGINPIITEPNEGTLLLGDKTGTTKSSAFDRINVRRLFIVLEKAISKAAKYSLFEFNDSFTRSQFVNMVKPYLKDVQSRRGITDFMVVCDTTNNTPERIDANQFWGDIYIKPNRSINWIQLNFVAVGTGVQFTTVVGQF